MDRVVKLGVLRDLNPEIEILIKQHLIGRELWYPADLLFPEGEDEAAQDEYTREHRVQATRLPPELKIVFVFNGLTESGLPHFHRLIAQHLEDEYPREHQPLARWNGIWTAEEDRHDGVLHDYLRLSRLVPAVAAVEKIQHDYLVAGFHPQWESDPFQLIAYTALQEEATQISHRNVAKPMAPLLARIVGHVAGEEGKHALFYRRVFSCLVRRAPDEALVSLWKVARNFVMPAVASTWYQDLAYVAFRLKVFAHEDYQGILERVLEEWQIAEINTRTAEGAQSRARLLDLPKAIGRRAALFARAKERNLCFTFLPDVKIVI